MGMHHIQLRDTGDRTQTGCTLGLHTVYTEAPCHRLLKKTYCSQKQRAYGIQKLKQGSGTQGPLPHSLPKQLGHCRKVWEP